MELEKCEGNDVGANEHITAVATMITSFDKNYVARSMRRLHEKLIFYSSVAHWFVTADVICNCH